MINFFGGASGPWKTSRSYPRSRKRFSAGSPIREVAKTRKRFLSLMAGEMEPTQGLRRADIRHDRTADHQLNIQNRRVQKIRGPRKVRTNVILLPCEKD